MIGAIVALIGVAICVVAIAGILEELTGGDDDRHFPD